MEVGRLASGILKGQAHIVNDINITNVNHSFYKVWLPDHTFHTHQTVK